MEILLLDELRKQKMVLNVKNSEEYIIIGTKRVNLEIILNILNPEIDVNFYGLFICPENQIINIKTLSNHLKGNSRSYVYIKAVLENHAQFYFEGLIRIVKRATLSDAYLKNDNLVLGEEVKVDSNPQLEIMQNDVKASHGVTIAPINDNEKYYLQSRGLDSYQAERLLIFGFINEILTKVPDAKLKNKVYTAINYGL